MARASAGERAAVLERVADLVAGEAESLATTIVREQGKTLGEARREVARVPDLLRLCAGEARRLGGETVPLDQGADGVGRLGLTLRVPVGVVVAITPFNYSPLLVAHKLGPAFAAGNRVNRGRADDRRRGGTDMSPSSSWPSDPEAAAA